MNVTLSILWICWGILVFCAFNIDTIKEKLHMLFGKKKENKVMEDVNKVNESTREETKTETAKPVEEWIWVKGYKGTDLDMRCRGYQYTLNERYDMPEDTEIKECESGFHLCKELKHVFKHYQVGYNNRFFEVEALVRKSDYENYGESTITFKNGYMSFTDDRTKLVAKSIIFTRELTVDEIVAQYDVDDWSDEDKKRIIELGWDGAQQHVQYCELTKLGYSETFAKIIVDQGKYTFARAVGSQPDLSMDMKCWLIFKN